MSLRWIILLVFAVILQNAESDDNVTRSDTEGITDMSLSSNFTYTTEADSSTIPTTENGTMELTTGTIKTEKKTKKSTTRTTPTTTKTPSPCQSEQNFNFLSFLIGVLVTVLFLVIVMFAKKIWEEEYANQRNYNYNRPQNDRHSSAGNMQLTEMGLSNGMAGDTMKPVVIEVQTLPPVQAADLSTYIKEHRADGSLKSQFHNLIPSNPALATIATAAANIKKNRYRNIFPNDTSRVILASKVTTEDTGYINASYINGFDGEASYIAAQGPLPQTLDDFWLMIWQEGVEKIVMLTHLTEGIDRVKCEKYWPDLDTEIVYDSIKVKCTSEATFFSYILRTMDVTFGEESRVVLQYHFVAWPDKKIPDDSSRLLRFMQEVTPVTEPIKNPIVVHCSAGIGRTGVYIAIDRQLKMLMKDECINVFNCCQDMRSNRPWMVQTVEQYLFIYECILEWYLCKDTFIATADFVKKANTSDVQEKRTQEFAVLEDIIPLAEELRQTQGKLEQNKEKNRSDDIIPQDGWRVILQREDTESNYINAEFLDGFVKPNEFIATQIPFQHTKQDFWEMVYEYDVTTIVLLDNGELRKEEVSYWPSSDEDLAYGAITIRLEQEEKDENFTKRNITIHHEEDQEEFQCVFLYHLTQLPCLQGSLTLLDPVCEILKVTGADRPENPSEGVTLVQCLDGATMSGVFLAAKICVDQMELEKGTDVFQAVKRVRKVQPKMVEEMSQYNLVFRILERYIEQQTEEEDAPEVAYANYRKCSATCGE